MATYYARKAGNINAADVWATTPSGTASNLFPTFANADVLMANSFAITVNVNTTVAEVRNDATGGATGGGSFTLSDNITLTANIFGGNISSTNCVNANPTASGAVNYIVGNITGGNATLATGLSLGGSTGNTVFVTGNVTAGSASFNAPMGINVNVSNLVLTGNVTGGAGNQGEGIRVSGVGNCTVNGTVTGGANGTGYGIRMSSVSSGRVTVNGMVVGGVAGAGINNESGAPIIVTRAVGNGFGGSSVGLGAAVGVSSVATQSAIIVADQLEFGALGQSPVNGRIRLKKVGSNVAIFNFCDTAGAKTLIDATANAAMPAATDVRSGVSYASGAATGSCAVPAAGSVALGVPVDATVGTAVLTAAAIRAELATELGRIDAAVSSRLAPNGTLATVTNLTNAPASVTPSDIWSHAARTLTSASGPSATDIRQELDSNSTKLANLDATVSSRLASSVSTNITAIKAKTDLLNTDRLAQCATTSIVGNLIAQSNS